ncbi:MAG: recombinase family protein [Eubacteriales bacterium]|nr:recombinase family protein [Eubacteriales bacterium]
MPRTSKYAPLTTDMQKKQTLWRAGLYVRLSREDGDKEESDSIGNQRALLQEFIAFESDVAIHDIYIDDGYSGTNFERPSFQRMMDDLKSRVINCVVVKDLSRFGRNYIEVGQYIEKIFPFMDVRFISINDSLDSVKNPQAMNNLIVPFKNIINDEYCRDISNKVRSSLDLKRKQGKFIGSFATYGYRKDPADHNHLVIDEEAATVVRDIFNWFIGGMSILGIAKKLNMLGILNPTAYKRSRGLQYAHSTGNNDVYWPDSSVRRILRNQVYTGCLVQGKNRIKSYKVQVSVAIPKKDWVVVPDAHEAILSEEIFLKAQSLFERDTRTAPNSGQVYLLAGFLKCADCGRAMNRKLYSQSNRSYCYYICSTFKKMSKGACTKHTIRSDKVEEALLQTLQKQIELAVDMDALIETINQNAHANRSNNRLLKALSQKEQQKASIERMKLSLYPDWKNGDLSKEDYQRLRSQFEGQIATLEEAIMQMQCELRESDNGVNGSNAFLNAFVKHRNLDKLTREVLVELVEVIYVHEGGELTIQFRFSDAFKQATEYIEQNRELQAL